MNENVTTPIMQKNVNDLTVGDALKINLVVAAVMVALPVVALGYSAVAGKVRTWKQDRKNAKSDSFMSEQ